MPFPADSPRGRVPSLPKGHTAALILVILLTTINSPAVFAQTWTREGPGTFLWSNPANWSALPPSSIATHITFNSATGSPFTAQNDLASPFLLNSLSIGGIGQGRITGNTLRLETNGAVLPTITQTGPNLFQISAPLFLNANTTFNATADAGPLALVGAITGPGALITTGGLAVTYGQYGAPVPDSTFTGGAFINGGSLDLFAQKSNPTFGTGAVNLTDASLNVHNSDDSAWTIPNALTLTGEVAIQSERGGQVLLTNNITLAGTLHGNGLVLSAGKQLRIDNSTAGLRAIYPTINSLNLPTVITSSIVDFNNAVSPNPLHLSSSNTDLFINGTGNTYSGGTIIEPNAYSGSTFIGVALNSTLGTGNVTVQAGARLELNGLGNISAGKTVNVMKGAFVEFAPAVPLGSAAIALIDPTSEGMLLITSTPVPGLNLTGHDKLILSTLTSAFIETPYTPAASTFRLVAPVGATLFISALSPAQPVLAGANALVVGQTGFNGDVYLTSPNTFTGGATVASGSVFASAQALGTGNVTVSGGNLYSQDADIFGPTSSLIVAGGSAFLSLPNHHTGGANLQSGRLSIDDPQALGSGLLTLSGGVLATTIAIPNPTQITGDTTLEGGANNAGTLAGPIALIGTHTLNIRNTFTVAGNITRSPGDLGTLNITNIGTLNITGAANTYTGGTTIGGTGQIIVDVGSSLGNGSVALTSGELITLADNAITGPASQLTISAGIAHLNAPSNYQGGTTIAGGIVEIGADNALGTGPVIISSGTLRPTNSPRSITNIIAVQAAGQVDLNGLNLTIAGLSGNGAITNSGSAATLHITGPLQPGNGIGTLTASGIAPNAVAIALAATSVTTLELAGTIPGVLHDRLTINGPLTIAGELHLSRAPGYAPKAGDSFDVITFLSSSGHFSTVTGIDAGNGLALAAIYLQDRVRIVTALPGDADLNGAIGFTDLVAVAQHYGASGQTWSTGDFDGDGAVDFSDLVRIAQGYTSGLPTSPIAGAPIDFNADLAAAFASVPEPTTLTLFAALALLTRRNSPQRRRTPIEERRIQ